jgi:signal transduction histidine kinase
MPVDFRFSLRARLLIAVSVLALTALAAVAIIARQGTRREFEKFQQLERTVTRQEPPDRIHQIAASLDGSCCEQDALRAAASRLRPNEGLVVDDRLSVLATTGPAFEQLSDVRVHVKDDLTTLDATRTGGEIQEGFTLQFRGGPVAPVMLRDGRRARIRIIRLPTPEQELPAVAFLSSLDRRLLMVTTSVGLLALAATWLLTRRVAGPIAELRDAARDLARGDLSRRVAARGSDDVAELARGFNAMAADLERQQTLRRNLVSDVAHELRTPLTALRCRLETIIDGLTTDPRRSVRDANEEVRHLSQLVDDLQELALAEARELRLNIGAVDLAEVTASAVRAAISSTAAEASLRIQVNIPSGLIARGDAVRVRQVLLNLLTNAERHTPPGGRITVDATVHDNRVAIGVHNTGSWLDDDQLPLVFDRFYRADPSRQRATGGTGLGLAVVKHLVEAQGGAVVARRDPSGVIFEFTLPR